MYQLTAHVNHGGPKRPAIRLVLLVICLLQPGFVPSAFAVQPPEYDLVDLQSLAEGALEIRDMNDRGQIVGIVTNPDESRSGVIYSGGQLTDIGAYLGETGAFYPVAINNHGHILLSETPKQPNFQYYQGADRQGAGGPYWLYGEAGLERLSSFFYSANDINDHGDMVGSRLYDYQRDWCGAPLIVIPVAIINGSQTEPGQYHPFSDFSDCRFLGARLEKIANDGSMTGQQGYWGVDDYGEPTPVSWSFIRKEGGTGRMPDFDWQFGMGRYLSSNGDYSATFGMVGDDEPPIVFQSYICALGSCLEWGPGRWPGSWFTASGGGVHEGADSVIRAVNDEGWGVGHVRGYDATFKFGVIGKGASDSDSLGDELYALVDLVADLQGRTDLAYPRLINNSGWIAGYSSDNSAYLLVPKRQPVSIDVQIWDGANRVRPGSGEFISVLLESTNVSHGDLADFDASDVDTTTLRFGRAGAPLSLAPWLDDIDSDGDGDLMLAFEERNAGILCGDTEVSVTGTTTGGTEFIGTDVIETVDCAGNSCHP